MYLAIIKVKPKENYILHLTFENGEERQFDMKPYLESGIFKELKDQRLFNTVKTSFDSIEWANEADFDPEVLYQKIALLNKTVAKSRYKLFLAVGCGGYHI